MQFSTFFAAAALSGLAAAVQLTNTVYNDITAGTTYSIGWSNATGPVTLTLKNGGANNLQTVSTITTGATTSPFSWNVPSTLPADTYAIEISDGSGTNYSPQFQLLGATASASASTASSTGSSSGSSTASSSRVSTSTSLIATTTASANSTSSTASAASNGTTSATGSSSGATSAGSSKTTTAAGGSKTSAAASSSSSVPATNSATEFASPLALVFLTFAAIFTLN